MPLSPGTFIGPYRVSALLGTGGMGEVYRATDARLKREIAIKVLPTEWADDADRVARFHREAELVAALNHPNVATIYGFEEHGNVKALLIELVEGPTLADRILHGPVPPEQAVSIARQIADALDAAHERGIVHRDLKPANIKVRQDGTVKVLDFGLAKATASSTDAGAITTMTAPELTSTGVVIGTPAYMSPEQARGQAVDKRTDIWAFGCALYEMLSGRPAFRGATVTDTLASILERDPDWTALPSTTPPALVRLIEHCVNKDVKRRLRDIGDARAELDEAAARARRGDATAAHPTWRRGWVVSAAAAALAAMSVAATLLVQHSLAGGPSRAPEAPWPAPTIIRATADEGVTADPALSSDGAMLAYASDRAGMNNLDIWVQQTAGSTPFQVTRDPVDELEPSFSPDGSRLAYRSERDGGGIYIVPTLGGQEPRLLVAGGRRPRFSPDGQLIAYWTGSTVGFAPNAGNYRAFVIRVDGGAAREIKGFSGVRYPVWAPDGRALLVLGSRDTRPLAETYDWWRVPLDDGSPPVSVGAKALLTSAGLPFAQGNVRPDAWRGDRVLFSDGRYLWSMHFDGGASAATAVDRLTFGTNQDFQVATAATGLVAFASASISNVVWSLPIDALRGVVTGAPRRVTPGAGMNSRPSASADGQRVAYRNAIPRPSIVVRDLATAKEIDTGIAGSGFGPALSPDGTSVAFEDSGGVALVAARGGSPRALCQSCQIGDWTADSMALVVVKAGNNAGRLTRIRIADGEMQDLIVSPDRAVNRPFPSPNGRLLAFRSGSSGDAVIVAPLARQPAPREAWIEIVAPETDARPAGWSPDGSLLYFVSARDGTRCLWARRVNRMNGMPEGDSFVVQHFHGGRNVYRQGLNVLSTGPGNAIASGAFFYDLSDLSSNIWIMPAPGERR
jgi:Tol biopolymer transport system component